MYLCVVILFFCSSAISINTAMLAVDADGLSFFFTFTHIHYDNVISIAIYMCLLLSISLSTTILYCINAHT